MVSSPSTSSSPSLSSRFRRFSFRVVVVRLFLLRRRRRRLLDDDDDDDDEDVSDDDDDEDVSDDDEESSRRRFVAIFVGLLSFSFYNNCETSLDFDDW